MSWWTRFASCLAYTHERELPHSNLSARSQQKAPESSALVAFYCVFRVCVCAVFSCSLPSDAANVVASRVSLES